MELDDEIADIMEKASYYYDNNADSSSQSPPKLNVDLKPEQPQSPLNGSSEQPLCPSDVEEGNVSSVCWKQKKSQTITVELSKDDLFYNTNHSKRGLALIFNQKYFEKHLGLDTRDGTEADSDAIRNTLESMNFEVIIHNDLEMRKLIKVWEKVAASDFTDCDCLLIVVLSHGERFSIYARDSLYTIDFLFSNFTPEKCPSLAGKPKIFVIQACQGNKTDPGVAVVCDQPGPYEIPLYSDILLAHATIPGFCAWRNKVHGSIFIRAFCEEMNRLWKDHELLQILTHVNRKLSFDYDAFIDNREVSSKNRTKQTCAFTSTLTRSLKFSPKQ
ncbi:hypothetical protein V9T40_001321 [Parthenolecanium corni]|uniref:Caspase-1 n=1 Tax=Parthenolecanium corni TaxID=536013 RepID=A0AAN9Y1B2_9HEMI